MIIIIIGLPCSGKTTFLKTLKSYEVYDDFISTIYDGELLSAVEYRSRKICIADPRLCNFETFERYIRTFTSYHNVLLLLFENNPVKCINNLETRTSARNVTSEINYFSSIYNIYKYKRYPHIVLDIKTARVKGHTRSPRF
jgi:GTPase SAR1 family protein